MWTSKENSLNTWTRCTIVLSVSATLLVGCGNGPSPTTTTRTPAVEPLTAADCVDSRLSFENLSAELVEPFDSTGALIPSGWTEPYNRPNERVRATLYDEIDFPPKLPGYGNRLFTAISPQPGEEEHLWHSGHFYRSLTQQLPNAAFDKLKPGCPFTLSADLGGFNDPDRDVVELSLRFEGSVFHPDRILGLYYDTYTRSLSVPDDGIPDPVTGWTRLSTSGLVPRFPLARVKLRIIFAKKEGDPPHSGFVDNIRFTYPDP